MVDDQLPLPEFPEPIFPALEQIRQTVFGPRRPAPDTLFHYTSVGGLHGITSNGAIWATNLRFLNDAKELRHALTRIRSLFRGAAPEWSSPRLEPLRRGIEEYLGADIQRDAYVVSFSGDGNRLSQWRGYCPKGGGYAIGFNARELVHGAAASSHFMASPCLYEKREQDAILRGILETTRAEFEKWTALGGVPRPEAVDHFLVHGLAVPLTVFAPLMKNRAFAEEDEWRLVSAVVRPGDPKIGYRTSNSILIPHYVLDLKWGVQPGTVDVGRIGPMQHNRLAREALEHYRHAGKSVLPIKRTECSPIPYREL